MLEAALRRSVALLGEGRRTIVLAVSGGPDSLALMQAAAALGSGEPRLRFHVVTIDHGLRPGSAEEAARVGIVATWFGLSQSVRCWAGDRTPGNLQAQAREARYRLLQDAARDLGAAAVMTAHHQDDQIETHFLAAARHAGDRGLAGMRPARALAPGLLLLRPFLDIPGAELKAAAALLQPVDDPSNRNRRFDRVRLREALAASDVDRGEILARIAGHAAARDAADRRLGDSLHRLRAGRRLSIGPDGTVDLDRQTLATMADEMALGLLERIVLAVSGANHPPPRAQTARLLARLATGPGEEPVAATLGGVRVAGEGQLVFSREYGRAGPAGVSLRPGRSTVFDGRFDVDPLTGGNPDCGGAEALRLVPLGQLGLGSAIERTLPIALDQAGRPIAAPVRLHRKLPPGIRDLPMAERLSWRLSADLPSHPPEA